MLASVAALASIFFSRVVSVGLSIAVRVAAQCDDYINYQRGSKQGTRDNSKYFHLDSAGEMV